MTYRKTKFLHFLFTLFVLLMSLSLWHYKVMFADFFLFVAGMNAMTALEYILTRLFDDD